MALIPAISGSSEPEELELWRLSGTPTQLPPSGQSPAPFYINYPLTMFRYVKIKYYYAYNMSLSLKYEIIVPVDVLVKTAPTYEGQRPLVQIAVQNSSGVGFSRTVRSEGGDTMQMSFRRCYQLASTSEQPAYCIPYEIWGIK